jgi:hypothetical protein
LISSSYKYRTADTLTQKFLIFLPAARGQDGAHFTATQLVRAGIS